MYSFTAKGFRTGKKMIIVEMSEDEALHILTGLDFVLTHRPWEPGSKMINTWTELHDSINSTLEKANE